MMLFTVPKSPQEKAEWDSVEGDLADERWQLDLERWHSEADAAEDGEVVEEQRPHDGPGTHIRVQHKHAEDAAEHVGGTAAKAHESGACKVVGHAELLAEEVEGRDEELVADDLEAVEDVEHDDDVQEEPTVLLPFVSLLLFIRMEAAGAAAAAVGVVEPGSVGKRVKEWCEKRTQYHLYILAVTDPCRLIIIEKINQ